MKSVSLSTNNSIRRIDPEILASRRADGRFFQAEERFLKLSLGEKIRLVMSYRPRIFQVETTTRCNLNCPLCSTHHLKRGRTDLPLELVAKICEANPQIRYMCLHLMGDPLLSPSLFPVIEYLRSRGIYTFFSTNGMLLEKKVPAILSSGLDKISISVDGITQKDLARYRVNAELETIIKGIRRLREEREAAGSDRPLIQTQTIMFAHNEEKEEEIVSFFKTLGVDRVKLKTPSFEAFGGRNGEAEASARSPEKVAGRFSREQRGYLKYRERAVCRLLFQSFILSEGSVVPCCVDFEGEAAFGNLRKQNWSHVQASREREEMLKRFFLGELDICKRCSLGYDYSITAFDIRESDSFS